MKILLVPVLLSMMILPVWAFQDVSPLKLLRTVINHCRDIKTLEYTGVQRERVKGKIIGNRALYRVAVNPVRVYFRELIPRKGLEILYYQGLRKNKLLINLNKFPWINIRLHPTHRQVRRGCHHLIPDAGFTYFMAILEHIIKKYPDDIQNMLSFIELSKKEDDQKYKFIELNNHFFKYITLKIKDQKTLISIARSRKISDYMILEKNKNINSYKDIKKDQLILIPSDYCQRMVITIDIKRVIPVRILLYDDIGLFEDYQFTDVTINKKFEKMEFNKKNPEYNF